MWLWAGPRGPPPAGDNELTRTLSLAPPFVLSAGDGSAKAVARQRGCPRLGRGKGTCCGMADAALPRRVICLAAGQQRHETGPGSKACALTASGCLIACLTPEPPSRRPHGPGKLRRWTPGARTPRTGSTPRYRAGQSPLPGRSTGVEAPHYPPGNTPRRQQRSAPTPTPERDYPNGCESLLFHRR